MPWTVPLRRLSALTLLIASTGCAPDAHVLKRDLSGEFHYTALDAAAPIRFVFDESSLWAYPADGGLETTPLVGFRIVRHVALDGDDCTETGEVACTLFEGDDRPRWYERSAMEVDFSIAYTPSPEQIGLQAGAVGIAVELGEDPWGRAERDAAGALTGFAVPARYTTEAGTVVEVVHRFAR